MAVYETLYWEGEVAATEADMDGLVSVALEISSSSAVTFCETEHGLSQ